uniref:Uroplakin 2 n=1 Tax=Sus scrofa TaxID=9823 RepID=A0A4X1SM08_PIG
MASPLPVRTLPLILILLAVLAPGASANFNISSLSGLLSPALTESLLVALPPCHLTGGNATLMVRRANDSKVVKSSFMVPPCRGRRELVSVVDSGSGFTVTRLSAYQVTNLVPGTKYYISYLVTKGASTESSREIPMSTLPRRKAEAIGLGMARTGHGGHHSAALCRHVPAGGGLHHCPGTGCPKVRRRHQAAGIFKKSKAPSFPPARDSAPRPQSPGFGPLVTSPPLPTPLPCSPFLPLSLCLFPKASAWPNTPRYSPRPTPWKLVSFHFSSLTNPSGNKNSPLPQ